MEATDLANTSTNEQVRAVASLVTQYEQAKMRVEELTEAEQLRQEQVAQRSAEIESQVAAMQRLEDQEKRAADAATAQQERLRKSLFDVDRMAWQSGNTLADSLTTAAFAGGSLSDVFQNLIQDIAMMIVKALIFRAIMLSLGGAGIGPFAAADGAVVASAKGRVLPFAKGSVVNKPTLFPFAGGTGLMAEEGPEAIMPLMRDNRGRLGVHAQMGGSGGGDVQVNMPVTVINNSDANVRTERRQNANGQPELIVTVEKELAGRLGRGEGQLSKAIQRNFGLNIAPQVK